MLTTSLRPRKFSDVHGHEKTLKVIKKNAENRSFPQAMLIRGSTGLGKSTLAQLIAMSINCDSPSEKGDPCCTCDSCKAVIEERFNLSIKRLDGGQSGKDDVVDFISEVTSKSLYGKNRVFIIEEADQLSIKAKNALLKVLEQPLHRVYFILLSMESKGIPSAIVGRCQTYNLWGLNKTEILLSLREDLTRANMWYTENVPKSYYHEVLPLIADSCRGSYRMALQLAETCYDAEVYTPDEAKKTFSLVSEEETLALTERLLAYDISVIEDIQKLSYSDFFEDSFSLLVDGAIYKQTGTTIKEFLIPSYQRLARYPQDDLINTYSTIMQNSQGYVNRTYFFSQLLVYLMKKAPKPSSRRIIES